MLLKPPLESMRSCGARGKERQNEWGGVKGEGVEREGGREG